MTGFFDRAASVAGRAAFEADKRRRIIAAQASIRGLRREMEQAYARIGETALNLYHAGQVTQPDLRQTCEHAAGLEAQIAALEREVESINNETYAPPAYPVPGAYGTARGAPGQGQYGDLCPNGHGPVPQGARYCPACGAQAIHVEPPAGPAYCPSCGAVLAPGARFCAGCGSAVIPAPESAAARPAAAAAPHVCPNCGTALVPGASFCPECGQPADQGRATPPETAPRSQAQWAPPPTSVAAPPPRAQAAAGHHCPHCGAPVVPQAVFCPECGQSVRPQTSAQAPPPTEERPQPQPAEVERRCTNCGARLVSEAVFCPECGKPADVKDAAAAEGLPAAEVKEPPAPVEESVPAPQQLAVAIDQCPHCGAEIVPGAVSCPDCGQAVQPSDELEAEPGAEEAPVEEAEEPETASQDVVTCANCGTELEPEADFCPEGGQPVAGEGSTVVEEAWPGGWEFSAEAAEETASPPDESTLAPSHCPNCGAELVPEAVLCPECGQTVEHVAESGADPPVQEAPEFSDEDEASPEQAVDQCPNCGTELVPEAVFCPECGQPVGQGNDAG